MDWLDALRGLRDARTPAVIVTLAMVRGHAPRNGGAKMVVAPDEVFETIGGGNLEATALAHARAMLASGTAEPELLTLTLSDRESAEYGVQCCGGEVTLMLEPVPVVPSIAVFGMGHVGLEVARILARQHLDLHLVDSREAMLEPSRLGGAGAPGPLAGAVARLHVHHAPVPESVLREVPAGTHVLVMTHDHAEDLAIVDQALRTDGIAFIGLIGSRSKWARFRRRLQDAGHDEAALARVTTPIGLPGITGKQPATIAVSVAACLLQLIEAAAPVATTRGNAR